mgnify:CR=1 FL=1
MIESVSSLFYLLHCSAHDRLNTMTFRSFRNIPHGLHHGDQPRERVEARLCLSTSHTDCIFNANLSTGKPNSFASAHPARIASIKKRKGGKANDSLPQHIPHGLHQQNRTDAMPQIHAICCELVDSFSDATKAASALTIFPRSSTVKAIYIAISDSLGRTIDRFLGCESHRKSLLAYASPNPHAGWGLRQCGQSLNRLVMKPHKLRIISFKGFLVKAF